MLQQRQIKGHLVNCIDLSSLEAAKSPGAVPFSPDVRRTNNGATEGADVQGNDIVETLRSLRSVNMCWEV